MTPSGKNIKLAVVYYGLPDDCRDFYKGLARRGIALTAVVNARVIMGAAGISGGAVRAVDFSSEGMYDLVPVDLIDRRRYNLGMRWGQLIKALSAAKPDIIHVFNEYHCFPVTQLILIRDIFLRGNIPIVCYNFQNLDYGGHSLAKYNLHRIQGLTSANQEGLDHALRQKANLKTRKIFWPVDQALFRPKDRTSCRRKLELPLDRKIIGYVGRLAQEKGLEDLLKAVKNIAGAVLLLIGEGEDRPRLQKIVQETGLTGRVTFKSFVAPAELVDYYNTFDCFVLPSKTTPHWKEQYGRVLVEAMICACPVVGSSSGAIPEVLNGYPSKVIFDEGDVPALARAIEVMIEAGAINAAPGHFKQFSNEHFVDQHIEFYQGILNEHTKN